MVKSLKNNIWFQLKDFIFIILGSFSYALAWQGFLIPNQLTTGAVTGSGVNPESVRPNSGITVHEACTPSVLRV